MATVNANVAGHGALVATTVDTVTLAGVSHTVTVINRGTAEIYFTVGSAAKPPATPTAGGADCYVVPAVAGQPVTVDSPTPGQPVVVKLISSSTPAYTVQGTR